MSKIVLKPNASGTGVFSLEAPNSNVDRTLTLPDEAGSVLTDASDISAANLTGDVAAERITGALNATGSAPVYACRAWVNFDGKNTVPIRASGNVSSITDNGTGQFTVNFSVGMPDDNYSYCVSSEGGSTTNVVGSIDVGRSSGINAIATIFRRVDDNGLINVANHSVAIFR